MFQYQKKINKKFIVELAKKEGLNLEEFEKCLEDKDGVLKKAIENDTKLAKKFMIRGTPTFIINNKKYEGYISYKKFVIIINNILKEIKK